MTGPLDGIKVLDLTQGAAGPTCAMHLGDMGAEVIKVEPPGGEWARDLGPPFLDGVAASFLGMNRNKRGIVVDLKHDEGAEVVLRIAESCDVALESFRPGVADRLGIGYEAMSARNPRLVYAAISAFGQSGPWRDRPGVDGVAQAMSGIMSITGTADGPPVKVGVPAADMAGGAFTSQALLAALVARDRTGHGQRVDVSLLDALLAFQVVPISMYLADGNPPERLGSAASYAAPNEAYPTKDGFVMVAAYTQRRWPAFCRAIDVPDLADDPRFDENGKRVVARRELAEAIEPVLRTKTTSEWIEIFDEADILCGPLLSYPELMRAEQVTSGEALVAVEHPAIGTIRGTSAPGRFSETRAGPSLPGPVYPGEHTAAVLTDHGFTQDEVSTLLEGGAIHDHERERRSGGR